MPDVIDLDQIDAYLQGISADLQQADFSGGMRQSADVLRQSHKQGFDSETGPSGKKWEPWHWRRPEASDSHKTLTDTGALQASVIGGPDHIENIGKDSLEFGTSKEYAGIHQHGGNVVTKIGMVGRGGVGYLPPGSEIVVPKREFVGMNEATVDKVVNTLADAAVEALKR